MGSQEPGGAAGKWGPLGCGAAADQALPWGSSQGSMRGLRPSPRGALGQHRTRALKEFIHEKTQGPSGRQSTGYKLQKLLSGQP